MTGVNASKPSADNFAIKMFYKNSRHFSAKAKRPTMAGSPRQEFSSIAISDVTPAMVYGSNKKRRKMLQKIQA